MTSTAKMLVASAAVLAVLGVLAESPGGQLSRVDFDKALSEKQVKGWGKARKDAISTGLIDSGDGETMTITDEGRAQLAAAKPAETLSGAAGAPDPATAKPPDPAPDPASSTSPAKASEVAPLPPVVGTPKVPDAHADPNLRTLAVQPGDTVPAGALAAGDTVTAAPAPEPGTRPRASAPVGEHAKPQGVDHPAALNEQQVSPCCKRPSSRVDDKHRQCACGNTYVTAV